MSDLPVIAALAALVGVTAGSVAHAGPDVGLAPSDHILRCSNGDRESCAEAAKAANQDGDLRGALKFFDRACVLRHVDACVHLAALVATSRDSRLAGVAGYVALRACALGHAPSCARVIRSAPPIEPAPSAVAARAERACEAGDGRACAVLGLLTRNGDGVRKDERRANHLYRRACDLDQSIGCFALSRAYYFGRKLPRDKALVVALERRACSLDPASCRKRKR